MRICWLNLGEAPDYAKMKRYGVEAPCFDIRDPVLRTQVGGRHYLDVVDEQVSGKPRVHVVQSWYPDLGPEAFARVADELLRQVGWFGNPAVELDIEKGAPLTDSTYVDFVRRALREWRRLRPTRETSYTLEGFQGGLFNGRYDAVVEIAGKTNHIVPQSYHGDMTPHQAGLVQNLVDYGFPREKVRVFYDAAITQEPWDGWLFNQSRLP